MDNTKALLDKTELTDRVLWYDGDVSISPECATDFISRCNREKLFVTDLTLEIQQYNEFVPKEEQLQLKTECNALDVSWIIPDEYKDLDVKNYVKDKFLTLVTEGTDFDEEHYPNEEDAGEAIRIRGFRMKEELRLYEKLNLFNVLRALIYIINRLESKEIVWGVGRGSSVSSYVLYLIGVHDIDSVKYELDIRDFLRTE